MTFTSAARIAIVAALVLPSVLLSAENLDLEAQPTVKPVVVADRPAAKAAPAQISAKEVVAAPTKPVGKDAAEVDDGKPTVRMVAIETHVARKYSWVVPALPIPPFTGLRKWFKDHENAVHCALEWRDDKGQWWHGELRSTHFDVNSEQYRVGYGEFPGTAYDAYGVYIMPGALPRDKDSDGETLVVAVDQKINADYKVIEAEVRKYAAKDAHPGDAGTGGTGSHNVGLGGPAYKPAQNSNTMINYILKKAGVTLPAPERAVGWDRKPDFPYSSDADAPALDCRP